MISNSKSIFIIILVAFCLIFDVFAGEKPKVSKKSNSNEWFLINQNAPWQPRAGLRVVDLNDNLYLLGGRTPLPPTYPPIPGDSDIWGDVWKSSDLGVSWAKIYDTTSAGNWPPRAYFQAEVKDEEIYIFGGQNFLVIPNPDTTFPPFIGVSDFFDDVWKSSDGIQWTELTDSAGWQGRAGLSSVVFNDDIYIMGGSFNDDPAIIGGPPVRVYFNDVWKSGDGENWIQLTDSAAWAPRAGAISVVKDDYMYLLGGEFGFLCQPLPCDPPYFNDVWRSQDGITWELVTDSAGWAPRPGHQVAVAGDKFVLFGGFGQSMDPSNPFGSANPMDIWMSNNGADWDKISDSPWNADSSEQIKYDFDIVVIRDDNNLGDNIFTFGGDRETFNFMDPTNFLNVDNDVWKYYLPDQPSSVDDKSGQIIPDEFSLSQNYPNPFNPATKVRYSIPHSSNVFINVFDILGNEVKILVNELKPAGTYEIEFEAANLPSGIYFYKLQAGSFVETKKMILLK